MNADTTGEREKVPIRVPESTAARAARGVVERLQAESFTAYWAGGCVRDMLLSHVPKDYDVATDATPEAIATLFPRSLHVGKSFGVTRVRIGDVLVEVATFREDAGYTDGRRPDAVIFTDARRDALRRDFTVNAMFFDPVSGHILDYVGGRRDLRDGVIRCVGDPAQRFAEDHLRMLRAIRFAATLEFSIHADTLHAVRKNAPSLARISAERVRDELTRMLLEAPRAGQALKLLLDAELLPVILPEIARMQGVEQPPEFHPEGDVLAHTILMLDHMPSDRDRQLAFSVLLHDVGKPPTARFHNGRIRFNRHAAEGAQIATDILKRLRFPTADIEAISNCVRNHMSFIDVQRMRESKLRRLIGSKTFETELELHRLDCLSSHRMLENHAFLVDYRARLAAEPALPAPWVVGNDIIAMGVAPGPEVGRFKQLAYDAQLEQRFPNRAKLLAWLRTQTGMREV